MQTLEKSSKEVRSEPLHFVLQDIATQVQVQPNFCIQHPTYRAFELPPEMVDRFNQLPALQRLNYLTLHCRSFLYGIYYNASMQAALLADSAESVQQPKDQFENNTVLGVDPVFFDQLHQSNAGSGYFQPDWAVIRHESDGAIVAQRGGLTLHLNPELHLVPDATTSVGSYVAVRMPKNLVQNGFYMAVGDAGNHRDTAELQLVRVYFNYSIEGAIEVMHQLTQRLNAVPIPFSFKTLYNPADYSRYDSGVLYIEQADYKAVQPMLQEVYAATQSYFRPEIPLFTKPLAPGVGLAEEPIQKFAEQESFGTNRCQMIAQGLVAAQQANETSAEAKLDHILQSFAHHRIRFDQPYLNPDSEDVYSPLMSC